MREVIEFATQRGSLLHPEVLAWLQTRARPLEELQRALPAGQLPMVLTLESLAGQRGAVTVAEARASGALAAAVAAAARALPARAQGPSRLDFPVLPPTVPPLEALAVPPTPTAPPFPAPPPRGPEPPAPATLAPLPPVAQVAHGLPDAPRLADALAALAPPVEVLKDITGRSTCTGELEDFTRYFNDRFRALRRMLRQRRELAGVMPIDAIPRNQTTTVKLIGLVSEVRTTKNGYRIIELEDDTGVVPLLVRRDDHRAVELGEDPERVMQDEVIGVVAKAVAGKDILYLEALFRPDVPKDREVHRAPEPALACFISDVHFGAKTFLEEPWERFIRWLHGQEGSPEQRRRAQQVKFLVVAGDVVDGIGVYPGQEGELAIPDIEQQYAFCARQFARVPDRIRVVMLPGNHDAVRPAEPQPAMSEPWRRGFKDNVTFVGNPCEVSLLGVEVLAYHGVSLIDYVQALRGLDVHKPIAIMQEILKRRHLAPTYGGSTPVAPEARDYLVVDRVPDVFVTGHLHTCDMGEYRGTTLINAGAWQAQTSYQKTLGIVPEPARVPVMDLQSGRRTVMRFDLDAAA